MNENANPIDFLIEFAWANGADRFIVNNAKDELKQLRQDNERWLNCELELSKTKIELDLFRGCYSYPVAWGKVNDRGDLYDIKILDNPYTPDDTCVTLYSNKVEAKDFYAKFRQKNDQQS